MSFDRTGYVEEDQDGFGGEERASIGELEMMDNWNQTLVGNDGHLESNDGCGMDQKWKQELSMMEGIKFATQIGKSTLCTVCSKTPPNLINKSET